MTQPCKQRQSRRRSGLGTKVNAASKGYEALFVESKNQQRPGVRTGRKEQRQGHGQKRGMQNQGQKQKHGHDNRSSCKQKCEGTSPMQSRPGNGDSCQHESGRQFPCQRQDRQMQRGGSKGKKGSNFVGKGKGYASKQSFNTSSKPRQARKAANQMQRLATEAKSSEKATRCGRLYQHRCAPSAALPELSCSSKLARFLLACLL